MPFTLTARADRIDDKGASLVITDYKTGMMPNDAAVKADARRNCRSKPRSRSVTADFRTSRAARVEALRYIRASGGEPPGEERHRSIRRYRRDLQTTARHGLERLIANSTIPNTPYRAIRRPGYRYDYDDYAHLARVAEWSAHVDEEAAP